MTTDPKRLRDLKTGVRDLIMLDPSIIKIEEGHNPRDYTLAENREHLDALKASIRAHGVRQPLWVRWDSGTKQAILVDGECRLRATLELIADGVEILSVPTVQVESGDAASRLVLALTANTGKPLSKWEDGAAYRKLVAYGWPDEKIAETTGQKSRYIREAIELAEAPQAVKEMLAEGSVSPALALKTVREQGDGATEVLAGKVEEAKAEAKAKGKTATPAKRERVTRGVKLSDEQASALRAMLGQCETIISGLKSPDLIDSESSTYPELLAGIREAIELF